MLGGVLSEVRERLFLRAQGEGVRVPFSGEGAVMSLAGAPSGQAGGETFHVSVAFWGSS